MLTIARAIKATGKKPKKTIIFAAWTGEEKGLLGSKAFADNPPLPIKNCVAMLNMDMIGRSVNDTLYIGGNTRCKELADLKIMMEALESDFELNRDKIEISINRKINETDWTILNILIDDPVISNKETAAKAFKSVDGVGSALRRMYDYFEIKESKYKKISLLMKAIKLSNT